MTYNRRPVDPRRGGRRQRGYAVLLDRRAGADQVAVAVGVVDAADGRPELLLARPGGGEGGALAGVGVLPLVGGDDLGGVGRVLEQVVRRGRRRPARSRGSPRGWRSSRRRSGRARPSARSRSARSSACRRPGRTRSGRGSRSPSAAWRCPPPRRPPRLEEAQVEDALVRHGAVACRCRAPGSASPSRVGDVVGVQDRHLARARQPRRRPSGGCTSRRWAGCWRCPRAPRRRRGCSRAAHRHHRVAGQERRQVRRDADRPHARPAAAVRDAEGLVQVQVADVGAEVARAGRGPTCAFMLAPSM